MANELAHLTARPIVLALSRDNANGVLEGFLDTEIPRDCQFKRRLDLSERSSFEDKDVVLRPSNSRTNDPEYDESYPQPLHRRILRQEHGPGEYNGGSKRHISRQRVSCPHEGTSDRPTSPATGRAVRCPRSRPG